jgi:hypothetical protein
MKKFNLFILPLILLTTIIYSCGKEDTPTDPAEGLAKIGSGYIAGAATKADVYIQNTTPLTGYQPISIILTDSVSGAYIDEAGIQLMPMMDMGMMKHSAPFENPVSTKATNHRFEAAVMFIMSSMGGTWTVDLVVNNLKNGKTGKLTLPVTVAEPAQKRMLSFTSAVDNTTKYFVSLVQPAKPKVGINDLEMVVYTKQSMMSFPADSALRISFEPEMPTMNHGSPNNIHPTHAAKGHYKGKVNFTMTGLWRLHFDMKVGDALAKTDSLDIEF